MSKRNVDEMADCLQQSIKRSKFEKPGLMLVDLHYDFLESIFKWLNVEDLMTMALASDHFGPLINDIIAKKYASIEIKFGYESVKRSNVLQKMQLITPLLRYYGHLITKLIVRFDSLQQNISQCSEIEQSILTFCNALKDLKLEHCRKGAFDGIRKPFEQLEVFCFRYGHLGQTISQFNKWFPKLRFLSIRYAYVANKFCIEETLPLLEHLDIEIGQANKRFSRSNIDSAVRRNPQLRGIHLNNNCKPRDLRFVNGKLKQLKRLEFWLNPENFQLSCDRLIRFKEVKELVLDICDEVPLPFPFFDRNSSNTFRFVCDKLEDLEIRCYDLQEKWFDFAGRNKLKKLKLLSRATPHHLMKVASNWPSLVELTFQVDCVSADDIVKFITACTHLQRLNIADTSQDVTTVTTKFKELESKLQHIRWQLVPMVTKMIYFDFKHSIIRK